MAQDARLGIGRLTAGSSGQGGGLRVFFILSKILGFFALPSNILISIGIAGLVLLCTRFIRLGSWLVVTSVALIGRS